MDHPKAARLVQGRSRFVRQPGRGLQGTNRTVQMLYGPCAHQYRGYRTNMAVRRYRGRRVCAGAPRQTTAGPCFSQRVTFYYPIMVAGPYGDKKGDQSAGDEFCWRPAGSGIEYVARQQYVCPAGSQHDPVWDGSFLSYRSVPGRPASLYLGRAGYRQTYGPVPAQPAKNIYRRPVRYTGFPEPGYYRNGILRTSVAIL